LHWGMECGWGREGKGRIEKWGRWCRRWMVYGVERYEIEPRGAELGGQKKDGAISNQEASLLGRGDGWGGGTRVLRRTRFQLKWKKAFFPRARGAPRRLPRRLSHPESSCTVSLENFASSREGGLSTTLGHRGTRVKLKSTGREVSFGWKGPEKETLACSARRAHLRS